MKYYCGLIGWSKWDYSQEAFLGETEAAFKEETESFQVRNVREKEATTQ